MEFVEAPASAWVTESLMTEPKLLERCRQGDRDAQKQLYEQTVAKIYRLLLRMTRNADDAHDLAQTTYVRVFESLGDFDGASSLTTWIYKIAVNEALQFLRSSRRREARHAEIASRGRTTTDDQLTQRRIEVEEALSALSPEDKGILVLRYFEGLSYAEMAHVLGLPGGTIASKLNRARERMRGLLDPDTTAR